MKTKSSKPCILHICDGYCCQVQRQNCHNVITNCDYLRLPRERTIAVTKASQSEICQTEARVITDHSAVNFIVTCTNQWHQSFFITGFANDHRYVYMKFLGLYDVSVIWTVVGVVSHCLKGNTAVLSFLRMWICLENVFKINHDDAIHVISPQNSVIYVLY